MTEFEHEMHIKSNNLEAVLLESLRNVDIVDMHTHLFPPGFSRLYLSGFDELLTYHYLVAEFCRVSKAAPEAFWHLEKDVQAEMIWNQLFHNNTPISEAAMGVLTVLKRLDIDPNQGIQKIRKDFQKLKSAGEEEYLSKILKISNVKEIVMTNNPLDPVETPFWGKPECLPNVFRASLRLDDLLAPISRTISFNQKDFRLPEDSGPLIDECVNVMNPVYFALSLSDQFHSDEDLLYKIDRLVFPKAKEHKVPVCLMIGARRGVNKTHGAAGDGAGKTDMRPMERICAKYADTDLLMTLLSRENQYELTVLARKFPRLVPFGAWWFLNNPFNFNEITEMRLLLLGFTFVLQHSDATSSGAFDL